MSDEISIDVIAKELEALHGHYGHTAGLVKASGSDAEFASFMALVCMQELGKEKLTHLFGSKLEPLTKSLQWLCDSYLPAHAITWMSDLEPLGPCCYCGENIYQAQDICMVPWDYGDVENGPELTSAACHRACKPEGVREYTEEDAAEESQAPLSVLAD